MSANIKEMTVKEIIKSLKFAPEEEIKQTLAKFPPFSLNEQMAETLKKSLRNVSGLDVDMLKEILSMVSVVGDILEERISSQAVLCRMKMGWPHVYPSEKERIRSDRVLQTISYLFFTSLMWEKLKISAEEEPKIIFNQKYPD